MKKLLVAAILGLAATASVMAQGRIFLLNYDADNAVGPAVLGVNGTTPIAPGSGFAAGVYYKLGSGQTFTDATGFADPAADGWILGTGTGSTALFNGPGFFQAASEFSVPGTSATASAPISVIIVTYSGASYAGAAFRGHSAAFNMTTAANTDAAPALFGAMSPFQVYSVAVVPEPSTFALAGLGLASLVIFRRRK